MNDPQNEIFKMVVIVVLVSVIVLSLLFLVAMKFHLFAIKERTASKLEIIIIIVLCIAILGLLFCQGEIKQLAKILYVV